jgi:hypothetical protein
MTRARREALEDVPPPRSTARCYLAFAMGFCLLAALLGAIWEQQAVFVAGLASFGLLCLQGLCGHCAGRIVVHNAVVDRPLDRPTL